jgi:YD repeat-containing protein
VGSTAHTYDANGNMLTGDGRTIVWDVENRPVSITKAGVTTTFVYDGDGSRVKQTVGSGSSGDTGWCAPSGYDGGGSLTNPGNAYASDNQYVVATASDQFQIHKNFNIPTIPTGATINGIEVSVEGYRGGTSAKSWIIAMSRNGDTFVNIADLVIPGGGHGPVLT